MLMHSAIITEEKKKIIMTKFVEVNQISEHYVHSSVVKWFLCSKLIAITLS